MIDIIIGVFTKFTFYNTVQLSLVHTCMSNLDSRLASLGGKGCKNVLGIIPLSLLRRFVNSFNIICESKIKSLL